MDSKRFLSRIAKLCDKLADKIEKEKGFPMPDNLKQFNALVAEYSKLLSTINEKSGKGGQMEQTAEDILTNGKRGAYEDLLVD